MKVETLERLPMQVFCLRYTGPFGEPLGKFWRNTVTPWLADHGLLDCPRYGVSLDNPTNTPPEKCRYDACVEVQPGLSLPEVSETTIAGGAYAVTTFKGTSAEIGSAWGAFVNQCLVTHTLDRQRPPFERYPRGAGYDLKTGAFACELYVAISS